MSRRETSRRRGGGRRSSAGISQLPWQRVTIPNAPIEPFSEDQIEAIHSTSLRVLEEVGIEFMEPAALSYLEKVGCSVDHAKGLVKFDKDLVMELVGLAPSEVTLTPWNEERYVTFGGNSINFGLVNGPANTLDQERGRQQGTFADLKDLLRLGQSLNAVHTTTSQAVAPTDLDPETRHLDCYLANMTLTDKVFLGMAFGGYRIVDGLEMWAIARGISRDDLVKSPSLMAIISVNSPRRFDGALSEGLIELALNGQPAVITPFTLMGAMTPVTLPAAMVQSNAEALAGVVLTQAVRPGTPVMYGCFTSNVDMKSGAPAFGTPEYTKAVQVGGQLARRYGLPYRSSNTNASNCVDAQATYESMMSLWAMVTGHANFGHHTFGWMEGGLTASFEKVVLDAEMVQGMIQYLQPTKFDEDELGFEAIAKVQPGGHFFGEDHTMARYETAFYQPIVSDWRNFETWEEAGAESATQRAHRIYKQLLESYEEPPLPLERKEALEAYVAKRKEEISSSAA